MGYTGAISYAIVKLTIIQVRQLMWRGACQVKQLKWEMDG